MIIYLGVGGNHNIFLEKFDGGLGLYSNFSQIVIEGISDVRWYSDCCLIKCDNSRENMVRIICSYYLFLSTYFLGL